MDSEIDQLAAALVAAQGAMPTVGKTAKNPFFNSRYAPLDAIVEVTRPVLLEHGLAVSQFPGRGTLKTYLIHSSGQYLCEEMDLAAVKDDPQGQGSALTYARRYAYCAVLGIVTDEDDDGNVAQSSARGQGSGHPAASTTKPATEAQIKYLTKLGGTPTEGMTTAQASEAIEALKGTAP